MSDSSSQDNRAQYDGDKPIRRIARNGSLALLAAVIQTLMTIFVLGILARALEKSELGLYFTVLVVAVVLQLLFEAGIGSIITLRISQAPERWREIAAEATGILLLVLVGSIVLPLLAGFGWSWWSDESLPMVLGVAAAATCAGMQIQQFSFGLFRGLERFEFECLSKIVQSATLLLLVWFLVAGENPALQTAVGCLAASYLAGATFCLVAIAMKFPFGRVAFGAGILKNWFSESVPLGMGIMLRRMTLQIDHLLLAILQPLAILGLYNVALRPLGPLNLLPQALAAASFPFMARSAVENANAHKTAFTNSIRILAIVAIPVTVAMWLLAEPIVLLLAGQDYAEAAAPLRVLATILLFSFPTALFRFALTAVNKQALYTKLVLATLLFQIVLEAVLISVIGIMGACYGFLVGEALFFAMGIVACKRLGILGAWWPGVVRAIPAGALLAIALGMCQSATVIQQLLAVGIGTLAFFGLCVLFGAIKPEELRTLRTELTRQRKKPSSRSTLKCRDSSSLDNGASPSRQLQ
jgi:O-antigen/teichoic acid export membrane protein